MQDLVKYTKAQGLKIPKKDQEALERLNRLVTKPTRGIEGAGDSTYRPEMLRLFQRTTTDESAPEGCVPGDVYAGGRILHKGKGGDGLLLIPILGWIGHQRWYVGDPRPNCSSQDGKWSVTGVECTTCPDEPWKDGKKQDCQKVLHFFFLPADLSGVYYVPFRSSSYKAGQNIVRAMNSRDNVWDAIFRVKTEMKTGDMGQYQVWKTSIVSDDEPAPHIKAIAEVLNQELGDARNEQLALQRKRREALAAAEGAVGGGDTIDVSADDDDEDDYDEM